MTSKWLGNWCCELVRSFSKNEEHEKQRWKDKGIATLNTSENLRACYDKVNQQIEQVTLEKLKHLLMLGLVVFSSICMWVFWQQWVGYIVLFTLRSKSNGNLPSLELNLCYHIEICRLSLSPSKVLWLKKNDLGSAFKGVTDRTVLITIYFVNFWASAWPWSHPFTS